MQQFFYFKDLLQFFIIIRILPLIRELLHMLQLATVTSFQYPVTKTRVLNFFSIIYHNFILKTPLVDFIPLQRYIACLTADCRSYTQSVVRRGSIIR